MNGLKEILLASTIIVWATSASAEDAKVQSELQKNKELVFRVLHTQSSHHVIWKKNHGSIPEENKIYFQEHVLPKIKLPITEDISWWVFKSHTSWNVVWIRYQLNTSPLQREHISVWIGKNNKAEITYSLKF